MRGLSVLGMGLAGVIGFGAGTTDAAEIGKVTMDLRLRHETAEISGLEDGDNTSIRARIGYFSPDWNGLSLGVEGEFTQPFDKDSYNAAGVHGDPAKAVIADPESTELDQLFVTYTQGARSATVGRQVIALDNHRFVGHVGWRQNRQTFDAVTLRDQSIEGMSLFYGYVDNVVRIFGSEAPDAGGNAGEAGSESHLLNGSFKVNDMLAVTAYAYLIELEDVPEALSSDSYGAYAKGTLPLGDLGFRYLIEYATQSDAGDNPVSYRADYIHATGGSSFGGLKVDVGYEVLGADEAGVDTEGAPVYGSFKTPLATLHKFNGFADRFLVTPPTGLEDIYVSLAYAVPVPGVGPVNTMVAYHDFASDIGGVDLGDEIDVVLAKGFELESVPGSFKGMAKYAAYSEGDEGADTDRFIIEINYATSF